MKRGAQISRLHEQLSSECVDKAHDDCTDESCTCTCHRQDAEREEDEGQN
jgi:hypothetical protein